MTWEPEIGSAVVVNAGEENARSGRVIDDFGDGTAHSVVVNNTRISDPARRWAVLVDDGDLVFVDTGDLAPPSA